MEIHLGKPVVTNDGERIGIVDRLVLDLDSMEFVEFIVHKGFLLSVDRIIERQLIEHVDDDGTIHLTVALDFVDHLPRFVEHGYLAPPPPTDERAPYIVGIAGPDPNAVLTGQEPAGHAYETFSRSIYEHASAMGPRLEVQSNLPSATVALRRGADVVDARGDKIGSLDELIYRDGVVQGFVVGSGNRDRHHVRVPADAVRSITHDRIQLRHTPE